MRVLVLCPLKPPDHPVASGERTVARLLMRALERAGHRPELASRLRMLERNGDPERMAALAARATAEADQIVAAERARPAGDRAGAVFTYHCFYKAPDVIGPRVAEALGLPYVVAEGSRAPKRAHGRFAEGHRLAEAALDRADAILVMNEADREMLELVRPPRQSLPAFPPFLDLADWPEPPPRAPAAMPRLVAVAMMRAGDKLASYEILAQALTRCADLPWTLSVVGEGPARAVVHGLMAPFGERITFAGLAEYGPALARHYAQADLLLWPAVNEAFGMVFLEAGTQACPSLAGDYGGVRAMVRDRETGRVVPGGDAGAFAAALRAMLADRGELVRMGRRARHFVERERGLEAAAARLAATLASLPAKGAA
jgi:glycosyltransferase involved in cell wall biosynthesis